MPTDEELEKYKKPDGTINWGKYAADQLSNQSSVINDQLYRELKSEFERLPLEINKVVKVVKTQQYKWKGKPRY